MRRLAWLGGVVVALVACGDDGGRGADAAAGDTVASSDAALFDGISPEDGQVTGDTGTAVDTVAPAEVTTGPVAVGVGVLVGEVDSAYVNVAFAAARFTRVVPPVDTSGTVYGPCRVADVDPAAAEPARYGLDAGVVTVSNTLPAVTLTPASEGVYGTGYTSSLAEDQEDLLPGGGAIVTVAAEGGADIAPFSGVVQMPEPVTVAFPATGLSATVDPAKSLAVLWNAGSGESVLVSLSPISATGQALKGKGIFCAVAGDPGQVEIPSAALVAALGGPGPVEMALGVTRTRTGTAQNAGHRVPLTATRSTGGPISLRYP